jgi:hypothetical protein
MHAQPRIFGMLATSTPESVIRMMQCWASLPPAGSFAGGS